MTDPQQQPVPAATPATAGRSAASKTRLVVMLVIAAFLILFVALNTHDTNVDFVFGSTKVSVIFVILLSLALGFVLGMFFPQLRRRRQGKQS
jgi:uncharacterized integral membrane protein